LALDELLHLDVARHVELAAEPREFTPPEPVSSDSLDRDWAQAIAAVRDDHVQRRREPSDGPAPGLTDQAWQFLSGEVQPPGRHKACVHAAATLA
jgi:hypothetical protein